MVFAWEVLQNLDFWAVGGHFGGSFIIFFGKNGGKPTERKKKTKNGVVSGVFALKMASRGDPKMETKLKIKLHAAKNSFIPIGEGATSTLPSKASIFKAAVELVNG